MDEIKRGQETKTLFESEATERNKEKSFKNKLNYALENITVEPCVLLYIIPNVIAYFALQNLYLDKACRVNLNYNETVCNALRSGESNIFIDLEKNVQELYTSVSAWKNFIQTSIPAFLVILVGGWSDRNGQRKPCVLLPVIGDFITYIGYFAFSSFFYNTPVEYLAIFECIFPGILGGWTIFLLGVFSYVADASAETERTKRVGFTTICLTFAITLGTALSGVILKFTDFRVVFVVCLFFNFIGVLYVWFFVPESTLKIKRKAKLFDLAHFKDTFVVILKRGEDNRRLKIILILFVVCVVYGPWQGEMTTLQLYTRLKLNWNELWFSVYNGFAMIINFLGNMMLISIFSGRLKFDDAVIGLISSCSKVFACFCYAFASVSWHMYFGSVVDMFNGVSYIALRSIASKIIPSEELGKLYSVFGFVEAFTPMIFGPVYLNIYNLTLAVFPGSIYFVGAGLTLSAILVFIWFYKDNREKGKNISRRDLEEAYLEK